MKPEEKALRLGSIFVIGAILLRLLCDPPVISPGFARLAIFLQTGRLVSISDEQAVEITAPAEEVSATAPTPQYTPVRFTKDDAALVKLINTTDYSVDMGALVTQALELELCGDAPTVLILHAHATESYRETDQYRTEDETKNMLSVGDRLAALLEAAGIGVIHDRTLHDASSYNGSYASARSSVKEYLEKYPSIRLVLDLHRDSTEDTQGNQIGYTQTTETGEAAKMLFVVGTDAGGLTHPDWQENLALAAKLHVLLEQAHPGICRSLQIRTSRFNQDLLPGALLVEIGSAGNTQAEALLAVEIFAESIIALAHGANTAEP